MAHSVFISHSTKDREVAQAIRKALEDEQIKCWIAPRDIPPGIPYQEAIIDAITASPLLVLIVSKDSNKSEDVKREIIIACRKDSPTQILPVRLDSDPFNKALLYYLSSLQWFDASKPPFEDHLRELVLDVRTRLSDPNKAVIESGNVREAIFKEETKPIVEQEETKPNSRGGKSLSGLLQQKKLLFAILAALIIVVAAGIFWAYKSGREHKTIGEVEKGTPTVKHDGGGHPAQVENKLYRAMNQSEKTEFIKQQAKLISAQLGNNPEQLDNEAIGEIQNWLENYDGRVGNGRNKLWETDPRFIFQQAQRYAPLIIKTFNDKGVPPIIGLYLPVIESEYSNFCQYPTKGIFQITPVIARKYGHKPGDLCEIDTSVQVAAQNMSDLIETWGRDSTGVTLAVFCFNRDVELLRRDLHRVSDGSQEEQSFWSLVEKEDRLDSEVRKELTYIPKFFAAAIIGENPQAFDLQMQKPLSTYTDPNR